MNILAQHIEALLFTAGEAVSLKDLAELTHVSDEQVAQALNEITAALLNTGISLLRTDTHVQMVTSKNVAEFLSQFILNNDALSKAALETISIIAYKGPISRVDIDVLRGVDSRRMIRQLLLRGLIRQQRISGQAALYEITEEFLAHIGVLKKEDLPHL